MSAPTNLFVCPPAQPVAGGFDESGSSRAVRTARSYRAVAAALRIGSHAGFIDGVGYRRFGFSNCSSTQSPAMAQIAPLMMRKLGDD